MARPRLKRNGKRRRPPDGPQADGTAGRGPGQAELGHPRGCLTLRIGGQANGRLAAPEASRLVESAREAEDDETVRLVVLRGAGADFCAGFEPGVPANLVEAFAALSKPTLAVIEGRAFDEGLELAMALDLRMAGPGARFALRQLECGRLPRFGGTQRLARLVGPAQALRMLLTGAELEGKDALRLGLVTYCFERRPAFEAGVESIVRAIVERAPLALRLAKEAVLHGLDMTLSQGVRLEEDLYALLQTTADRAEGIVSFLEKRKPVFKGF